MIRGDNRGRGFVKTVDWALIAVYLLLVLIGWMNIYSASYSPETVWYDFAGRSGKQLVWIAGAIGLGALILFVIPPRLYETIAGPVYVVMLVLLVAVIFLGTEHKGSNSWFSFGPVSFQPAELSKISTSMMLAAFMGRYGYRMNSTRDLLVTLGILALPMLAILMENETGSMLVYIGFVFMLYREGLSGWIIALGALIVVVFIVTLTKSPFSAILLAMTAITLCNEIRCGRLKRWFAVYFPILILLIAYAVVWYKVCDVRPDCLFSQFKPIYILIPFLVALCLAYLIMGFRNISNFRLLSIGALVACVIMSFSVEFIFANVLQEHQRKRIEVLLGMTEDPSGVGYNVRQSMIAIGSGGFFGKGYLNGTQTTYGFVPEQSTDFIFCTIGEEWGFLGATLVILLYVFLIWRILRAAENSREGFTRIYGYCVACCFFMHLVINIGMTIGLMPVIGIPLPFLSYGGSSLWSFTIMLFIFIALVRNERRFF